MKVSNWDTERYLELGRDKMAARTVFQTACRHYHNTLNSISHSEQLMWDHLRETYHLDPAKEYTIKYNNLERRAVIEELREENDEGF